MPAATASTAPAATPPLRGAGVRQIRRLTARPATGSHPTWRSASADQAPRRPGPTTGRRRLQRRPRRAVGTDPRAVPPAWHRNGQFVTTSMTQPTPTRTRTNTSATGQAADRGAGSGPTRPSRPVPNLSAAAAGYSWPLPRRSNGNRSPQIGQAGPRLRCPVRLGGSPRRSRRRPGRGIDRVVRQPDSGEWERLVRQATASW